MCTYVSKICIYFLTEAEQFFMSLQSSIVPRNFTYKPGPLIFWQFNSN